MTQLLIKVGGGTLAALVLLAAPATAAVTTTNVTSPADGARLEMTDDPATGTFPVTGTAPGPDGEVVDIRCFPGSGNSPDSVPVAQNLAVTGGTFSGNGSTYALRGARCRLRAVPDGVTSEPAGATGPTVAGYVLTRRYAGDFEVNASAVAGLTASRFEGESIAAGGLVDLAPRRPDLSEGHPTFGDSGSFRENPPGRENAIVDGEAALMPPEIANSFGERWKKPGFIPQASQTTVDAATGEVTLKTQEPLMHCAEEPCSNSEQVPSPVDRYEPSGLRIDRTMTTRRGGRIVEVVDRYVSTDGAAHTYDFVYAQGTYTDETIRGFQIGSGEYEPYPGSATVAEPARTVRFKVDRSAPASYDAPHGAIVFDEVPAAMLFAPRDFSKGSWLMTRFTGTVPAGGFKEIRQSFVTSVGDELETLVDDVDERYFPTPDPGDDGEQGQQGQQNQQVQTQTTPPSQPAAVAPPVITAPLSRPVQALAIRLRAASRQRFGRTGRIDLRAGCGALPCTLTATASITTGRARASARVKVKRVSARAAAGREVRLRFKLSRKARSTVQRALKLRRGRATARIVVTAVDAAGRRTRRTLTVRGAR